MCRRLLPSRIRLPHACLKASPFQRPRPIPSRPLIVAAWTKSISTCRERTAADAVAPQARAPSEISLEAMGEPVAIIEVAKDVAALVDRSRACSERAGKVECPVAPLPEKKTMRSPPSGVAKLSDDVSTRVDASRLGARSARGNDRREGSLVFQEPVAVSICKVEADDVAIVVNPVCPRDEWPRGNQRSGSFQASCRGRDGRGSRGRCRQRL